MRFRGRAREDRGFTLLEVVVAVAVLSIGAAVVFQVFSGGLKNLHRVDMAHRAMDHAENVMNELLTDQEIRSAHQESADLDDDFDYIATVEPWVDPNGSDLALQAPPVGVELLKITVEVNFKNSRNRRFYRTTCLKAIGPEEQLPGVRSPADAIRRLFGGSQPGGRRP